jgi:hypothetical protein
MAAVGFPDATNTGVSAGVSLTRHDGNLVINTPGVVIEGLDIRGYVSINADNVILRNCRVTTDHHFGVGVSGRGVTVENCEINGQGAGSGATGIAGGGTFLRNDIFGFENGIMVTQDNTLIQDNYIHDLLDSGVGPHYDGIAIHGMSGGIDNVTIRHNTVHNNHNQTSAIYIAPDLGSISNIVVDNNLLMGGGYTIHAGWTPGEPSVTGIQFTNNYLDGGAFGFANIVRISPVWQGNVDADSGRIVAQDGSLQGPAPTPPAPTPPPPEPIPEEPALPEPAAPVITSYSNDSGVAGDGITNDNTLRLTGTAAANSTVRVYDGQDLLGTVSASGSGVWSFTTTTLANGSHSFTATATDAAGNVRAALSPMNVRVDRVAPAAPTITGFSNDTGMVGDGITNDNTLTLTGTAEANSTVRVYDGADLLGSTITNGSGAWSYTTDTLSNDVHSFRARATDVAGNTSAASNSTSVTVESLPPSLGEAVWRHSDGRIVTANYDLGELSDSWRVAANGDFDGDGDSDILFRRDSGQVVIWEMQDGQYRINHNLPWTSTDWEIVGAGDFDADADADIIWRHRDGAVVTWEIENGEYVQHHHVQFASVQWRIDGLGDFDADGDADVIWRHRDGAVVTWEMENGTYIANHNLPVASISWQIQGTGDFDGDGDADVLFRNRDGMVVTWEVESGNFVTNHNHGLVSSTWQIAGTGDFEYDGDADIMWRNNDGQVAIWEMRNGDLVEGHGIGTVSTDWQIGRFNGFGLE